MTRCSLVGILLFALAFLARSDSAPVPDDSTKVPADLAKERVDIARKVYEQLRDSKGNLEMQYTWSRRWLDAELARCKGKKDRIAAFKAHLERMKNLQKIAKEFWDKRSIGNTEFEGAKFFPVEAEIWLWQAEHK
jgi:hypothetical protein